MDSQEEIDDINFLEPTDYLTVAQAAQYLSTLITPEVNGKEILSIALQRALKLSVKIPINTPAIHYNCDDFEELHNITIVDSTKNQLTEGKNIIHLNGYYYLSMDGGGYNEVEYILNFIKFGYAQKFINLFGGTYVEDIINGEVYQIQEIVDDFEYAKNLHVDKKYYYNNSIWRPAGILPKDSKLMVRQSDLDDPKVKQAIEEARKETQERKKENSTESIREIDNDIFKEEKENDQKKDNIDKEVLDDPVKKEEPLDIAIESSPQDVQQNYFRRFNKRWHIRFNGGTEGIVNDCKPIKVLLYYLIKPFEHVSPASIHAIFNEDIPSFESFEEEQLTITNVKELNIDESKILDDKGRNEMQNYLKEIIKKIEKNKEDGNYQEVEESQKAFMRFKKDIEENYKGVKVKDNGTIKVFKKAALGKNRAQEYVTRNFKKAIEHIKKEGMKDLAEHLTNCLLNKKDIYIPTDYKPNWDIRY